MNLMALMLLMHPFHVSLAEAEWNAETERLEVALRLDPGDLEAAIHRQSEKRVDLERDEAKRVERAVTDYLKRRTYLARGERRGAFRWVGIKDQTKYVWVFFELVPPEGDEPLRLHHAVLTELVSGQANTILLRRGERRASLRFTRQRPEQPLPIGD